MRGETIFESATEASNSFSICTKKMFVFLVELKPVRCHNSTNILICCIQKKTLTTLTNAAKANTGNEPECFT